MEKSVQIFNNSKFGKLAIIDIDGESWFIGKQVAKVLEYHNTAEAVKDHCKYLKILKNSKSLPLEIPPRGWQIINESDLYRLIMASKLPTAEKFKDWVCEEVLPSIRKTGSYKIEDETPKPKLITLEIAEVTKATLEIAKIYGLEGNQALLSTNNAVRYDTGVDCMAKLGINGLVSESKIQYFIPTVLAKDLYISAIKFNRQLESFGLQTKKRGVKGQLVWCPTETGKPHCQLVDIGKKHSPDGKPIIQVQWAESVLDFFSDNPIENMGVK